MVFYIVQYYDKNHKKWKAWYYSPFYLTLKEAKRDAAIIEEGFLVKARIRKYRSFEGQAINID